MIQSVTKDTIAKAIADSKVETDLYFTAPWDQIGQKYLQTLDPNDPNHLILTIDFDTERELVSKWSVRSLPFKVAYK